MSNDARSQIKVFSMGAAMLMVAATEIIVGNYYSNTLQGWSRVALVGLLVVAWVIFWATWWASKAEEDIRVKYTAYIVALTVSGVMIFNGAMVIADMTLDKRVERADRSAVAKIKARGEAATDLKKAGGTWRELRELNRSQETEESNVLRSDSPTESDIDRYKWVKDYMSFEIFFVPLLAALIGKFVLVGIIALPGGASGYLPSSANRPAPNSLGSTSSGLTGLGGSSFGSRPVSESVTSSPMTVSGRGGEGIGFRFGNDGPKDRRPR